MKRLLLLPVLALLSGCSTLPEISFTNEGGQPNLVIKISGKETVPAK